MASSFDRFHPSFRMIEKFAQFPSRRSVVFARKAIVATPNPIASSAGLEILSKGGNAADASIAVAAVLSLVDPAMGGLGGDTFCMFYDNRSRSVKGLNGSGRSPARLNLDHIRHAGILGNEIPTTNVNSITVPGSCQAWIDILNNFGSKKLKLSELLEPAIKLSDQGFPISEISSNIWKHSKNLLLKNSPNGHELLINDDQPPYTGQLMFNPYMKDTLTLISEKGRDGFYKGLVAERIVKVIKSKGGVMELSDLASHTSTMVQPISYTYHKTSKEHGGITLNELPPNGQGLTALIALGILECLEEKKIVNLNRIKHNSTQWLHTLIECIRIAFSDTIYHISDPEKVNVPVFELLKKDYLLERAQLFDPLKAHTGLKRGNPIKSQDTVYFTCSDQDGNACSFIMSNYTDFGSGIVPEGCGFALQSRGNSFTLEKGHPNCLEPNKRPYHTIIPAMVTRDDDLLLSLGVMGGFMQPQGHLQVILNIIHAKLDVQAALDAPRFCVAVSTADQSLSHKDIDVYLEDGIDMSVVEELNKMGHRVKLITGYKRALFGRGQIIQKMIDQNTGLSVWAGGSDPRADGQATVLL